MKKLIFLTTVLLFGLIAQKDYGQSSSSSTTWVAGNYLGWSTSENIPFKINGSLLMDLTTAGNLNIRMPANGYQIDSNMVLWYNSLTSSIYVGVGAGSGTSATSSTQCTFVGNNAGSADREDGNTGIGYNALTANTYAIQNTAVGGNALATQSYSSGNTRYNTNNTAVGYNALFSNNPTRYPNGTDNTAIGQNSLYSNITGASNTALGQNSLFTNDTGNSNVALGTDAMYYNTYGYQNVSGGVFSLYNNTVGYGNTTSGSFSMYSNVNGGDNVAVGINALYTNAGGFNNTAVGPFADMTTANLDNATAIGVSAEAAANNQMELGNNNATVTMGRSGLAPLTPVTRLELNTQYGSAPFTYTASANAPSWVNTGRGTGWSGLRFDDLTALSTPGKNPGRGYLSVDSFGHVIYVDTAFGGGGSGTGIGYCSSSLTAMTGDGGYNLNSNNFYFAGNGAGTLVNNVGIGFGCSSTPPAKLSVLQASGTNNSNSIGLNVENDDDYTPGVSCPISNTQPNVIGIKSFMPPNSSIQTSKVAGWFEADESPNCCSTSLQSAQYAIYVPANGGNVALGYIWNSSMTGSSYQTCPSNFELDVHGSAFLSSGTLWTTSDSTIKTDVKPISNPLDVIKQLKGISYDYIPSAISDSGSVGTHYGFIAQQVARVIPNVVKTNRSTGKEGVAYTEIIPWLVEGMKEQQQTIDSLRTIVTSIQNRLSQGSSTTGDNSSGNPNLGVTGPEQNVTLSSTDAPLLYQNMPNPFSSGTKINYYLPVGTMGATIAFYDTYGNQIKVVPLSQTGNSTLNVTSENLANGIYSYSLIVNGSVIDTKKMLLQK